MLPAALVTCVSSTHCIRCPALRHIGRPVRTGWAILGVRSANPLMGRTLWKLRAKLRSKYRASGHCGLAARRPVERRNRFSNSWLKAKFAPTTFHAPCRAGSGHREGCGLETPTAPRSSPLSPAPQNYAGPTARRTAAQLASGSGRSRPTAGTGHRRAVTTASGSGAPATSAARPGAAVETPTC